VRDWNRRPAWRRTG